MNSKVVIVGAGFAGLNAAKGLVNIKGIEVTLVDRRNHHLFQPLLYQVAMAGLSPAEIAIPIRGEFRRARNVEVLMAEVREVRPRENRIVTDQGELAYDHLVLACGAEHSYFGKDQWEDFAPGLKTVEQGTEIRRRVLLAFERAEAEGDRGADASTLAPWLTFVVIGGGPTGVELAGALAEITYHTLNRDFRHINPRNTRVLLIEAGPRLLASFGDVSAAHAVRDLKKMGVQIRTDARVTDIDAEGVSVGPEKIAAKTVIWAAGVKPSPLNAQLLSPLDKHGRVQVGADFTLPEFKNIFVLGDQAAYTGADGKPLPGLAPVAMQEGRWVAETIRRRAQGLAPKPFHYLNKGQMATIGRRRAVAEVGRFRVDGVIAWLLWLTIHIYYLVGFHNRFFVMWEWAYSYFTYRRGARLITNRDWHSTRG